MHATGGQYSASDMHAGQNIPKVKVRCLGTLCSVLPSLENLWHTTMMTLIKYMCGPAAAAHGP